MLAIRLQRRGRKGIAQYRVVVQDSRLTPSSGRVVAALGNFDPHSKAVTIDKEKAEFYLKNGARPSDRVARLLQAEKIELPKWVTIDISKQRSTRNPDKLRKNQPAEEAAPVEEPVAEEPTVEEASAEAPAEETPEAEAAPEEAPAEEPAPEEPADAESTAQ